MAVHIEKQPSIVSPILAPLVAKRSTTYLLVGVAAAQVGLTAAGLPAWNCPIREVTGIPCPGCGLSRAIDALIHGKWQTAMAYHIFAPVFLFTFILMAIISVLPEAAHRRAVDVITQVELRTGLVVLLLMGLMIYWGIRLFWLGFGPV